MTSERADGQHSAAALRKGTMMKRVALFGILAMVGLGARAEALIITSQGTALPGGGSCAISNITTTGSGATFNCTGIVLTGHTNVYLGIRNTVSPNGNTMTNADPTTSSAAVFRSSSTSANTITYTSTTSVNSALVGNVAVTNTLNLTRTAGTGAVTPTGGVTPANNGNGDINHLFKITAAGTFTLDVDILANAAGIGSGQACPAVYDPAHLAPSGVAGGDRSRVDLQFYWSDCGDGQIDSPEVCDDGANNGTASSCCTTSCTFKSAGSSCNFGNGTSECSNADTCSGTANTCLNNDVAAGTSCTDTSAPGTNDPNQCKDAQCNGSGVCNQTQGNEANGTACADGNYCTTGDTCQSGTCTAGGGNPCPGADGDADCSETCVDTGFEVGNCDGDDPNGSSCAGNGAGECSGADTCSAGVCQNNDVSVGTPCTDTSPPGSNDPNQCKDAECNGSGVCNQAQGNETNGTSCADGDFCTTGDTCQAGSCAAGGGNPCPGADGDADCSETCIDTGFEVGNCNGNDPDGSSCAGNGTGECSGADTCSSGTCMNNDVAAGTQCTDTASPATGNCKDAECDGSGSCDQNFADEANGTACADGDYCTTGDTCQSGTCDAGAGNPCPGADGDADCSESCVDTGYEVGNCNGADPNGSSCTDGLFCNGTDTCSSGACTVHTGDPCPGPDGDGNCAESCDEANDNCLANDPNGSSCAGNGTNECSNADTCNAGTCEDNDVAAGTACTDTSSPATGNCKAAECNGTGSCDQNFANEPNGTACADGNFCTTGDTCQTGSCAAGTGDPCPGPDGDTDCSESCVDTGYETGNCNGPDPDGTLCRPDTGECDVQETCQSGVCPADDFEPNGTACGNPSDTECDNPDTCNGSNVCLSNNEPANTPCGSGDDTDCTDPDSCDGSGSCLANNEIAGTLCTDDGETCTTDECDSGGLCTHPAGNLGTECRAASVGQECDEPEECDGINPTCPADGVKPNGTLCRGSAGVCDIIENCDGVGFDCPPDQFEPSSTECRADTGECDVPENCTGSGPLCPPNDFEPSGTSCGDPANTDCDNPDTCDGSNNCLVNHEPAMTACTSDGETCTVDECDGTGLCQHPAGNLGTECRAAAGLCDLAESCDGTNPTCPVDAIRGVGEVCRADQGECDTAELCDGVTVNCPPDVTEPDGTPCGSPGDSDCSNPDTCLAGACDPNNEPTSVECRAASAGEACDAAEFCDGAGNCPADAPATTSVVCRPSVDVCDVADHCDGINFDCPTDAKSTAVCRPLAGVCDLPDSCDGVNDACPADAKSTAECRPVNPLQPICDVAENCDGVGNNCPADGFEPNGTDCSNGLFCDGAETCQTGVCTDNPDPCTSPTNYCEEATDSCLASSCATTPIMTCRSAQKSLLLIKSKDDNTKDRLVWKWIKGAATTQVDFGNPTTTASYALCIYDNTGLVGTMDVPPDSNKWVAIGTKGYKYTDLTATEDGAFKIKVKGSDSAKSKALVKGRGSDLMDPIDTSALVLPVKVQLVNNSNGICFESNFSTMKLNSTSKFKAKSP